MQFSKLFSFVAVAMLVVFFFAGLVTIPAVAWTSTTPLADQQIVIIHQDPAGQWSDVGTAQTDTDGTYTLSVTEPTAGPYGYEVWFTGDSSYAPTYTPLVLTVGS